MGEALVRCCGMARQMVFVRAIQLEIVMEKMQEPQNLIPLATGDVFQRMPKKPTQVLAEESPGSSASAHFAQKCERTQSIQLTRRAAPSAQSRVSPHRYYLKFQP